MKIKLFYSAGSCSMCCKIALEEAKLDHEAVLVDFDQPGKVVEEVARLNPQGALPIAVIEGKTLTQNIAILEYIADNAPASKLLPPPGTVERAEVMRWLSFTATDLHKAFSPLFGLERVFQNPATQADVRKWAVGSISDLFEVAEEQLSRNEYLTGKNFTAADAYFFVVTGWTQWVDISLEKYPKIQAFLKRVAERPMVAKVLKEAGMAD